MVQPRAERQRACGAAEGPGFCEESLVNGCPTRSPFSSLSSWRWLSRAPCHAAPCNAELRSSGRSWTFRWQQKRQRRSRHPLIRPQEFFPRTRRCLACPLTFFRRVGGISKGKGKFEKKIRFSVSSDSATRTAAFLWLADTHATNRVQCVTSGYRKVREETGSESLMGNARCENREEKNTEKPGCCWEERDGVREISEPQMGSLKRFRRRRNS